MTQRHEDSDDDTFVTLGSAFEKLETVEDVEKAKRKKDKEHYVTDDQGRRRFHGAFTGGFSAGYFNTVGSEEGKHSISEVVVSTLYLTM
jgi:G patch domain-containing protein 1